VDVFFYTDIDYTFSNGNYFFGNQIIDLDVKVQREARKIGLAWADKMASANPGFAKVLASQRDFEKGWQGAERWRSIKG
jgi:hypothetical protein